MAKTTKIKPLNESEIQAIVKEAVEDAVDFIESNLAEEWEKADRYFKGKVDIGEEEGRSKVVASKCRDTIRAIKPDIMKIFMASKKPVEFVPMGPEDVMSAEQMTEYAQFKLRQKGLYQLLNSATHDSSVKKVGIVKATWEETIKQTFQDYTNLGEDELAFILSEDTTTDVEVVEWDTNEDGSYDVKLSFTDTDGDLVYDSIPPEDFFVSSSAKCIDDAYCCGHSDPEMRVGDVVAMGYDIDDVLEHAGDEATFAQQEARLNRTGRSFNEEDESNDDPSMQKIMVTEAYMAIDAEGTGVAQLHRFLLLGDKYHLLDYEPVEDVPFAVFEIDPEPHTFFGRSIMDIVMDDQDASTSMLRGVLDNVAMVNNQGAQVIEGLANMEDLLNNEIGRIVRVKSQDAIKYDNVPFTAGYTLPALQYYDQVIENKTGVSRATQGLDPDALQNTTAAGVKAMVNAAEGQVEYMARNLAETGFARLAYLTAKLTAQNAKKEVMIMRGGAFVPMDPRSWNIHMNMQVNVGLGTGGEAEKEFVLREVLANQKEIIMTYGPQNGLVGLTNIYNTMVDMLEFGGLFNSERYYQQMTPEKEMQLLEAQAKAAEGQQGQDPATMMMQAELGKAQINAASREKIEMGKLQAQAMKSIGQLSIEAQKANQSADIRRDQMLQERVMDAARILGEFGIKIDQNVIKREQALNDNTQQTVSPNGPTPRQ